MIGNNDQKCSFAGSAQIIGPTNLLSTPLITSIDDWTVRDFYTLGEEFAYVALVQKADKKIKSFAFDVGNLISLTSHLKVCHGESCIPWRHISLQRLRSECKKLTCVENIFSKNKYFVLVSVHMLSGLYIALTCVEKRFLVKINI